ncbi:MAG: 3-oxoacyl-[acyl-carrier-protein] reductase [Ignavibacteria bacterium]|nr:3-oxoacyl-[acyl-carrier-protein] reductase [Ignavibacteria bacterium]
MEKKLEGKIAVITGGCRGIGKAMVELFARQGAIVYTIDHVIPQEGEAFIEDAEIASSIACLQADVTKEESVNNAFAEILKRSNRIDILINNAGITRDNLLLRLSEQDWDAVLDTNLKGAFLCTKAVAKPMMAQRAGRIINIASVVGQIGNAGQSNYSASKAGMFGFTKSIARELSSRNILVNCIAPGYVRTPMTEKLTDEQKQAFIQNIPLKRVAEPLDIANAASFLASDESSYITGHVLHVNGGMAM